MTNRNEADEWGTATPNIVSPERLALIREVLEQSPIIVEHWFYRGSRAPDRIIVDDFDVFEEYLRAKTQPGDAIHVWRYDTLCRNDNALTHGKVPDVQELTPKRGAY
jgi:hypothetical protein